jgi:hypothetical protein
MKTKIINTKKVSIFWCLFILFCFNHKIYSQIIYTDIPDATPNATYSLDLNNDTIIDFTFGFGGSGSSIGVFCNPLNNNAYAGNFVNGTYFPWALSASNTICASLATWYDSNTSGTMSLGASIGYWPGETNKYLALRLNVGDNTYYGWARLDFLEMSGSFTIKDYAYQSTPNACIQAGQSNLSSNENMGQSVFSVYPNPFNSSATLQTYSNYKNVSLTIYNFNGQIVKQKTNLSGQIFSLFRENLPNGMYFISLSEENKIIGIEKILISD